jgi:hypothetical protein
MNRKKYPWLQFGSFLLLRVFSISVILLVFLMSLPNSRARAEDTGVIVSPQIDISVGPGDSKGGGQLGTSVAFDEINNRFLAVWGDDRNDASDGNPYYWELDIYGQLVNADGTLYGSPIAISVPSGSEQLSPKSAFDPDNRRFLVVWYDGRNGSWLPYGQLINADGSLYGNEFLIYSPPPEWWYNTPEWRPYAPMYPSGVTFDTINKRFLVLLYGQTSFGIVPINVYAQFISSDGQLDGTLIQISNYTTGYGSTEPKVANDSNNGRFLVTWTLADDNSSYGRLINGDGTFYGEEINIGYWSEGDFCSSSSFDPINNRFAVFYTSPVTIPGLFIGKAQLINADGTLFGAQVTFPYYDLWYGWFLFSTTFDPANEKFIFIGGNGSLIFGQFLNLDLSLYGSKFDLGSGGLLQNPSVVFGSGAIGSLVVWADTPSSYLPDNIFGKFIKLETPTPVNRPPVLDPIGNKTVNEGELLQFTITATDPDGDALTYSASSLPTGARFDPSTQTFSWTPDCAQAGSYFVHFEVTDGNLVNGEDIIITVNDVTPVKLIDDLIKYIGNSNLPKGTEQSLTSNLYNAIKSLGKSQGDAAVNRLNIFINEVKALRGKKLTNEQADELVRAAQKIIYFIGCS